MSEIVESVYIPPSTVKSIKTMKRQGSASKGSAGPDAKRSRRNSFETASTAEFPPFDSDNPNHVNKMHQRHKDISMGKNTVGYARYTEIVPVEKRKPFSMETPSTPDHTVDIPNKRWRGMVKAWRRALHRFDPPDVKAPHESSTLSVAATAGEEKINGTVEFANDVTIDVQSPMALSSPMATTNAMDEGTPLSVLTDESARRGRDLEAEFRQEERVRWGDMSDSDDDDDLL